jgi:hypothetical protein
MLKPLDLKSLLYELAYLRGVDSYVLTTYEYLFVRSEIRNYLQLQPEMNMHVAFTQDALVINGVRILKGELNVAPPKGFCGSTATNECEWVYEKPKKKRKASR